MKVTKPLQTLIFTAILGAQLFFLYSGYFTSTFYDDALLIIAVIVVLGGVPYFLTKFLQSLFAFSDTAQLIAMMIGMLSVIGHGIFFGFWIGRQEMKAYKTHGVWTWGTVTKSFNSHGPRMYYSFSANGIYYMSANVHNPLYHSEGDSVEVVYNLLNPDMNSAAENLDE